MIRHKEMMNPSRIKKLLQDSGAKTAVITEPAEFVAPESVGLAPAPAAPPRRRRPAVGSVRFAWLGAGHCGGRILAAFRSLGYGRTLALNTTRRDLDRLELPASHKMLLDIGREGAGKDMALGQKAVELHQQKILERMHKSFGGDTDHVMLCFGAGGGTGGGSIVELVTLARSYVRQIGLQRTGKSVGVIMTLPTAGEAASGAVGRNASIVAGELALMAHRGEISPLVIIDNDRVCPKQSNLTVKSYWPSINRRIAELFDTFNRQSWLPSEYTAFDPADYSSILTAGGCAVMGYTEIRDLYDRNCITRAIRDRLDQSLLAGSFDLSTARVIGGLVIGGQNQFAEIPGLAETIQYAFDTLAQVTGNATVHRGIYEDDREVLRLYTLLGGCDAPDARLRRLTH